MATEYCELSSVQSGSVLSFDRRGTGVSRWLRRSGDQFNGSAIAHVGGDGIVRFWYIGRAGVRCDVLHSARLGRYVRVEAAPCHVDGDAVAAEFERLKELGARYVLWHMPVSWLLAAAREPKSQVVSLLLRALILPIAVLVALCARASEVARPPAFVCSTIVNAVLRATGVDLRVRLSKSKHNHGGEPSAVDRLLARYFLTPSDVQRAVSGVEVVDVQHSLAA